MGTPRLWDTFLDHFLVAVPGFTKLLAVSMEAFVDASDIQRAGNPSTLVVAAVLFDKAGVETFNREWQPQTVGLPGPFRASQCNGGWNGKIHRDQSRELLKGLAELTGRTRDTGFVALVDEGEYRNWQQKNQSLSKRIGPPYAIALMAILDACSQYMKENYPDQGVYYWFESGTQNEKEAKRIIRQVDDDEKRRERFRMNGHVFSAKQDASALCAADFLAWEYQRNYVEAEANEKAGLSAGPWRDNFKLLFKDHSSKPIRPMFIGEKGMNVRALVNGFYGLGL